VGKRLSLQSIQKIAIVDNIAVRKVKRAALLAQLRKYLTLALRAIYIASRKSRVPHSKTLGRKLLRRCNASDLAAGDPLRLLRQHRSIVKVTPLGAIFLSFIARQRIPSEGPHRAHQVGENGS
jgi:hypothetical protein